VTALDNSKNNVELISIRFKRFELLIITYVVFIASNNTPYKYITRPIDVYKLFTTNRVENSVVLATLLNNINLFRLNVTVLYNSKNNIE
jgi:ABC-type sulfate transport system permease component